ncbi:hypothetical protein [Mastigocoleus testarum]|uniref:Uncharacterized protein n=1 Tax=Mastigocoleus testarum BC008 TaxID=371196 RepID=A0A0V8A0Y6_9CYAN|nr:hypothetical protein [Mastigocoleus testarum]KST70409.1 hypothetical protein BC008_45285 [Mastigocoleus testarum BC008]
MEDWNKTWGYSGLVGEWYIEASGGKGNILQERFKYLIQTLDFLICPLQVFHKLYTVRVDLSILDDKNIGEEKSFVEDLELESKDMIEIIPELEKIFISHVNCLFTKVNLELNTIVLEQNKELILPESAELYIGTESSSSLDTEVDLFVSYSTFIDVWLSKTLDRNKNQRDNTSPSQ